MQSCSHRVCASVQPQWWNTNLHHLLGMPACGLQRRLNSFSWNDGHSTGTRIIFVSFLIECLGERRLATALQGYSCHLMSLRLLFLLALTTSISFSIALSIFLPLTYNPLQITCPVHRQGNIWSNTSVCIAVPDIPSMLFLCCLQL